MASNLHVACFHFFNLSKPIRYGILVFYMNNVFIKPSAENDISKTLSSKYQGFSSKVFLFNPLDPNMAMVAVKVFYQSPVSCLEKRHNITPYLSNCLVFFKSTNKKH